MTPSPLRAASVLALALFVSAGCGNHVDLHLNGPNVDPSAAIPYSGDPELQPGGPLAPELDNVWPNQDQMSWAYAETVDEIGTYEVPLFPNAEDVPPLVAAARRGDHSAVRMLLRQKADPNAAQTDGTTALHWAVQADDVDLVAMLVKAGANVQATNRYGIPPLTLAATNGSAKAIASVSK